MNNMRTGVREVEALLLESSLTRNPPPPPEAKSFLHSRGMPSEPPARAYALLMSIAEAEASDQCGTKLLSKLRGTMSENTDTPKSKQAMKQRIARLV